MIILQHLHGLASDHRFRGAFQLPAHQQHTDSHLGQGPCMGNTVGHKSRPGSR